MNDILNGQATQEVNGNASIDNLTVPNKAKKFDFWYKIEGYADNPTYDGRISFWFSAPEGASWYQTCSVEFIVTGNTEYGHVEFETSIECAKVTVHFSGTFKATNMQLIPVTTDVNTATTKSVGTVRPISNGGLKIVEKDTMDESGNVTAKAGDLSLNIGDGLNINSEGKLTTTSDLSGSNWQSIDDFLDGWTVNGTLGEDGSITGGYWFKILSNGNLQYLNANRTIRCTSHNSNMPSFPTSTGGGTSGS